jgi:hypothetical protein
MDCKVYKTRKLDRTTLLRKLIQRKEYSVIAALAKCDQDKMQELSIPFSWKKDVEITNW